MAVIVMAVGKDRPGLTRSLADTIMAADGNWLESHFARLGSEFVGSVLVDVSADRLDELRAAAAEMDAAGFHVTVLPSDDGAAPAGQRLAFEIMGRDRPGIVREVSAALAELEVNIEELESATEDGAMFGERLFRARARVVVPDGTPVETVRRKLEDLSGEIMVDFEERAVR